MLIPLNPKNNFRLSSLTTELNPVASDLAVFDDVSAGTPQKARTCTWSNLFSKIWSFGIFSTETTIASDDLIPFQDVSASGQQTKLLTFANLTTAILAGVINRFIPTGVAVPWLGGDAPTGWVLLSGKSIGDGSSGATGRANADTLDLFTLLWNNFGNTELPIQTSGGITVTRGASAALDFADHKRFPLPDLRGRTFIGLDNMGGTAASRVVSAVTPGQGLGVEKQSLVLANIPQHFHAYSYENPNTVLNIDIATDGASSKTTLNNTNPTSTVTLNTGYNNGSNATVTPVVTVQPSFVGWVMAKL